MNTLDIVRNRLNFLVEEYGFSFEYSNTNGDHYIFKNQNGYIEFYEWEQFDESAIFVKCNGCSKNIDLILEYPKIAGEFNKTHKGVKWFFKDKRYDYWDMISRIISIEINTNKSIFGLNLEHSRD